MKLPCAGCGTPIKVGFRTWWHYWIRRTQPYWHLPCLEDMESQKRIDGV